jgi:regulator of sigma E protease
MIFDTLGLLFSNTVGVSDLSGPVGIYTITSNALSQGLVTFINWTALLSVNLGILNLLPIPALDGGRLVFLGYEGITKRKVNRTVENYLHAAMFILLIGFFFYITYHDILRLFNIG